MAISNKIEFALRQIPPKMILEPYLDFFMINSFQEEETKKDFTMNKNILKKEFYKVLVEGDSKYSKKKKEIFLIADEIIKKLHNIMWIDFGDEIIEMDYKNIDDFYKLLKLIKKSDERKITWALYHLFFSNGKSIQLTKLQKLVEPLKIKNIEKYVKKIIKDTKENGLGIEFDGKIIKINLDKSNSKDKKTIKHALADQLEYLTRRSRRGLEQEILDLLDEGSYSNQEISKIINVDKSHVSKTLKKLERNNDVKHSSFGSKGKHFYTTNCDNCPFGTNYDACRKESISFIQNYLKEDFKINLEEEFFEPIEYNQSLLNIKGVLTMGRKDKSAKLEITTISLLSSIYEMILQQISKDVKKASPKSSYFKLEPLVEKMAISGVAGHYIGQITGSSLMVTLFEQSLAKYIPKAKQKKAFTEMMGEFRKISRIKNLQSEKIH